MGLNVGLRGQGGMLRRFAVSEPINYANQHAAIAFANHKSIAIRCRQMARPGRDTNLPAGHDARIDDCRMDDGRIGFRAQPAPAQNPPTQRCRGTDFSIIHQPVHSDRSILENSSGRGAFLEYVF